MKLVMALISPPLTKPHWMRSFSMPAESSISPRPMSFSAPGESRMVMESVLEATRKAIRRGKLPLMTPEITSTEGLWVAIITWIPAARPFWARRMMELVMLLDAARTSGLAPMVMVRSAYSSTMVTR